MCSTRELLPEFCADYHYARATSQFCMDKCVQVMISTLCPTYLMSGHVSSAQEMPRRQRCSRCFTATAWKLAAMSARACNRHMSHERQETNYPG